MTSIDDQIYGKALGSSYGVIGEVWSTYSLINEHVFGIILAADIKSQSYNLDAKNIGFKVNVII